MSSPTARALEHCRKQGWIADVVERFNAHSFHKNDLFGFADLIVIGRCRGLPPLALQVTGSTTGGNHAARVRKILDEPRAELWLRDGGEIEVWSFSMRGSAGKRKTYELRREPIELGRFARVSDSYEFCVARTIEHLERLKLEKAERRKAKKAEKDRKAAELAAIQTASRARIHGLVDLALNPPVDDQGRPIESIRDAMVRAIRWQCQRCTGSGRDGGDQCPCCKGTGYTDHEPSFHAL